MTQATAEKTAIPVNARMRKRMILNRKPFLTRSLPKAIDISVKSYYATPE